MKAVNKGAGNDSEPILKTVGLTKRYGKRLALADLNLEMRGAGVLGFLGPNGAGKTTAISLILGLIAPTHGRVEIFGMDPRAHPGPALRRTGAVLEGPSFYPHLSARDNLRVFGAVSDGAAAGRVEEMLELVGLRERAKDKLAGYSLGMKQRLAVAAALLSDPELLILDEPTNGLDPAGMREFRELIRQLGRAGKTVFVASHLLNEVEQMCDEVAIIKEGRLIARGPVADIVNRGGAIELKASDMQRAKEILESLECVRRVTFEDERLVVEAPAERAVELSRALAEKGVYLAELRPRETSLEEFFLEVTQESA